MTGSSPPSSTSSSPFVDILDHAASFLRALIRHALAPRAALHHEVPFPRGLSRRLIDDCFHAASVILEAFERRYRMKWKLQDYEAQLGVKQSGRNELLEARLAEMFPSLWSQGKDGYPVEHRPAVVLDNDGVILMVYAPGVLRKDRQVIITSAVEELGKASPPTVKLKSQTWRTDTGTFKNPELCEIPPGVACFAPAWWAVGHEKSSLPGPSTPLKSKSGIKFVDEMEESLALVGAILSVVHPELYEIGCHVMNEMRVADESQVKYPEQVHRVLKTWASPFTALSLIINRETIQHRDTSGPRYGMDILVTGGRYENGRFETPGLGLRWAYDPGTLVALLGKILLHGVAPVNGERWCLAHFWRERLVTNSNRSMPAPPILSQLLSQLKTPEESEELGAFT
ncbi:hypothetical protein CC1G_03999 [Coprinopsis cinerea okayama7|uniref:2OGFeDO JBP1/TET oxygenase domain-containing protein n=1 Tax=Coprinopsis cinerea (strain Okayama-7 / 130 / ATCC MYA-4618 / FGSC 9003) TaxID=240176 RepID=A8N8F2_COPC7|nr:hypothetical protein CC1G_03999 [Coprinopsis cinerea okayama7\|eukprot:XP_001831108.2 hypothetical protein CC1G_03999 [Coprinopsis cinerea okayama7\